MTIAEQSASLNMKLLAHHPMDGFGNCGEGMAMQRTRDKRRVAPRVYHVLARGERDRRALQRLGRLRVTPGEREAPGQKDEPHRAEQNVCSAGRCRWSRQSDGLALGHRLRRQATACGEVRTA